MKKINYKLQHGIADLFIVIILLAVMATSVIFLSKFVILDVRTTANIKRYAEALTTSDYAMEQAISYLNENAKLVSSSSTWIWTACPDANPPCGDGTNAYYTNGIYFTATNQVATSDSSLGFTTYFVTEDNGGTKPGDMPFITLLNVASSDTGLGQAVASLEIKAKPMAANTAPAPLVATGSVNGSGSFRVWGYDEDAGGPDNPLSIWSADDVTVSGNLATIDPVATPYDPSISNPNAYTKLTHKSGAIGVDGFDIVANDTNFPSDLFQFVFGVPDADHQQIKDLATPATACETLTTGGFYWINTGTNCAFSGNTTYGSATDPVLIVVDGGELRINAGVEFYGMIYKRGTADVQVNGGPVIYGAIILDSQVDLGNGSVDLVYDNDVLNNINKNNKIFTPINGSWNDDY